MLVRDLVDRVFHKNYTLRVKNILHVTIINQGTKDIIVRGKAIIKPGKGWNSPDGSGIPMRNTYEVPIEVTGVNATENNYYLIYTTLGEQKEC